MVHEWRIPLCAVAACSHDWARNICCCFQYSAANLLLQYQRIHAWHMQTPRALCHSSSTRLRLSICLIRLCSIIIMAYAIGCCTSAPTTITHSCTLAHQRRANNFIRTNANWKKRKRNKTTHTHSHLHIAQTKAAQHQQRTSQEESRRAIKKYEKLLLFLHKWIEWIFLFFIFMNMWTVCRWLPCSVHTK